MTTSSQTSGSTSLSLLVRVQRHDEEAWRRFVDLYSPLVYGRCRQSGLGPDDAADVLQETFRGVHAGIEKFRPQAPGAFRGWLRTIVTNKICDHFRRRGEHLPAIGGTKAQLQMLMTPDGAISESKTPDSASSRVSLVHRAAELVRAEFEPHTWQAFWLTAVEGLTSVDAGHRLDMQPNTVRQAKYKVLHRLRQELSGLEEF
jgi:RNA polymerase sigma-70 factor (ECF subfamily)